MSELLSRVQRALELAKSAGANDVWASTGRSRRVSFEMRQGKLENVKDSTSRSLDLRLYVNGRYSSVSTNDLRDEQLTSFVADAIALAGALQPDEHRKLADPALYDGRHSGDLELIDSAVEAVSREQRLAWLEEMNSLLRDESGVVSASSTVSSSTGESAAVSTNGFSGTNKGTSLWLGSSVTLKDDEGKLTEGDMHGGGRHVSDLPTPTAVADLAMARGRARLGSTKGPTKKTNLVIDPSAAGRILGRLLSGASGSSVERDRSFWKGKLGTKAVSDILTVVDDPLVVRGLGSRLYDGEGITAKAMPLVEKGELKNYYLSTYYASKLNMRPTTGGGSNRIITLGDKDLSALLAEAGEGIYLTSWLGGNSDGTTGDFSFGLRGHLIDKGKIGAPVGEMNVTGNLLDLFERLVAVGNDPWPYSSMRTPTLVFEGVDFAGA